MAYLNLSNLEGEPSLKNLTSGFGKIPEKQNEMLQGLGAPHVESFNYMLREGLQKAVGNLFPMEFLLPPNNDRISLKIESAKIYPPVIPPGTAGVKCPNIYPSECRQRAASYKGRLIIQVSSKVNEVHGGIHEKDMGAIPIIVKSDVCHLAKLSPRELIEKGEHAEEWGGYFIIKGHERLIRMLHMSRRNYPITVRRAGWKNRGVMFSDLGVFIRCVNEEDQTSANNVLHFLRNGSAKLMFSYQRTIYYTPIVLILKALLDVTDEFILRQAMTGYEEDTYFKGCLMNMLRAIHEEGLHTHKQVKEYIGKTFRVRFQMLAPWKTDTEICNYILDMGLAIHLKSNEDKFNLYIFMLQKLYSAFQNKSCEEGVDAVMMHELLIGGHLYLQVVKDRLQTWLYMLKFIILKKASATQNFKLNDVELLNALRRSGTVDSSLEAFIGTGNLVSHSSLGLQQDKGLTIVCENINRMRYMSHFKSVHRGSFFQEMRSSEPRQLLPDAWGFICPVHTPDGAPCGLLNHLTKYCEVTTLPDPKLVDNIPALLVTFGMLPLKGVHNITLNHNEQYVVMLDGCVLGHVAKEEASRLVHKLRLLKVEGKQVPQTLEIALVPLGRKCGQFPGLFLFTGPTRMMRPVYNLAAKGVELIGTFEQVYMDICIYPEEAYEETTHQELTDTSFLSHLACLIPLPDCNQSPRNMYQCQMGKQTMGNPCHNWHIQAETKMYRLQTPATPFFRPYHYDITGLDEFAMGTNAIVAVISYTGYDMEDAMIINKSSYERGFAHGCMYKSEFIQLKSTESYFQRDPDKEDLQTSLDADGLPYPGILVTQGQPFCCHFDAENSRYCLEKWNSKENAYVDSVRLCGNLSIREGEKACIVFRIPRNPSVGDKFASRAGQKGICSYLWPAEDLPYTETGLIPDIVFNPHGFPSRMTIAMMIEVMAGKSAALHGLVHDATPFKFSENDTAIDYFGRLLEAGGYNYYSTERMYSGVDGRELTADIFFGVVHYQRLRHMVLDKWQVRSTGPIDIVTHQPVKGRRRGGGVRFGEMERDALLSHGASFLLQDRLFHCSDKTSMLICKTCGSIVSPIIISQIRGGSFKKVIRCQICSEAGNVQEIDFPYIFKYLVAQLASVNIKIKIDVVEK